MKLPLDLQPGDILHIKNWVLGDKAVVKGYAKDVDNTQWVDVEHPCRYSFNTTTGIAEPTRIEVVRIQRVNSGGVSDEMKYNTECMIRQERCTKGIVARELSHILCNSTDDTLREHIIDYQTKLNREAADL